LSATRICAVLLILGGLAGCQFGHKPEKPLAAPQVGASVSHFSGTPLSGPTIAPIGVANPRDVYAARVSFVAWEKSGIALGEPIGTAARFIAATRSGTPVIPSARLMRTTRVLPEGPVGLGGRSAGIADQTAALAPGSTAIFEIAEINGKGRRIEIDVHRPGAGASSGLQIALVIDDWMVETKVQDAGPVGTEAGPAEAPAPGPAVFGRELAIIERPPLGASEGLSFFVPMRFEGSDAGSIVATVEITPGSADPKHAELVAQGAIELRQSIEAAAKRSDTAVIAPSAWSSLDVAIGGLARENRRRASLVFLAGETRARLCEDAALVADASSLAALVGVLSKELNPPASTQPATAPASASASMPVRHPTSDDIGWLLDRVTFITLGKMLGDAKIPPELASVLMTYAGEAGRHAASVEEVRRGMSTRAEFENRLMAENIIFLEDNSPASRVRAYDWLKAREKAPAGFDPLGPARERRIALDKAANPPTSAPAGGKP
jgi:hypothetical protein